MKSANRLSVVRMKLLIVVAVFGIMAIQESSATSMAADASKAAGDATKAVGDATKAVGDATAAGTAAVSGAVSGAMSAGKGPIDAAMAAAADPMGAAQGIAGQAMAALPMDMSKITSMYSPMTTMMRDIAVNGMDAGEVMLSGTLDHASKGVGAMGKQMTNVPVIGGMVTPFWDMGAQLLSMPRGVASTGFNVGRQGLNGLFGFLGVPAGPTKNALKPEYSEGGFQIPFLSSLTGLMPKVPGLPTAQPAAQP